MKRNVGYGFLMLKQRMRAAAACAGHFASRVPTPTLPQLPALPLQDERLSSVLFFTEYYCRTSSKEIHPLFLDLCNKCKHMTVCVLPLPKTGLFSMHMLGLKSPTFQFYLHGEKVKELSTRSMGRVYKISENVYREWLIGSVSVSFQQVRVAGSLLLGHSLQDPHFWPA